MAIQVQVQGGGLQVVQLKQLLGPQWCKPKWWFLSLMMLTWSHQLSKISAHGWRSTYFTWRCERWKKKGSWQTFQYDFRSRTHVNRTSRSLSHATPILKDFILNSRSLKRHKGTQCKGAFRSHSIQELGNQIFKKGRAKAQRSKDFAGQRSYLRLRIISVVLVVHGTRSLVIIGVRSVHN